MEERVRHLTEPTFVMNIKNIQRSFFLVLFFTFGATILLSLSNKCAKVDFRVDPKAFKSIDILPLISIYIGTGLYSGAVWQLTAGYMNGHFPLLCAFTICSAL